MASLQPPPTANAGKLHVDLFLDGPGFHFSTGRNHYRYGHRRYFRDYDYDVRPARRTCRPRKALRKARRMGVRDPYIARIKRRAIVVKGYRWGDQVKVKFGRSRSCPVMVVRGF